MRIGVVFPQTEIGTDPMAVRDFAQAAESLGFSYLLAYDHVLGANADSRPGWRGAYRHTDRFHEVMVLFGYVAGLTENLGLVTGILILPQRQTPLVAKQAAEVDVLSGGRLRLGIGIGWNDVEYEALSESFHNRGRRSEEQLEVMRLLWTNELVTYEGRWHTITDGGINPLPVQRPIPVWFGGMDERVLKRLARIGDGWMPQGSPDDRLRAMIERVRTYAGDAGRDPAEIGIDGRTTIRGTPEDWAREMAGWEDVGATHVSVNTIGAGLSTPDAHIDAIRRFKEAVG
jgi:probable F420-dependent oxidoreductase